MNRALCRQLDHSFVTAIYAVIDTGRSAVTVANAGHPPLLIGGSSRGITEVHERGLLLGFKPDASYVNAEVDLHDGDRILLYTDGVLEAQNAKAEFFDGERVGRWLTSANSRDAAWLSDTAIAELNQWRNHVPFEDDVTFVIAQLDTNYRRFGS